MMPTNNQVVEIEESILQEITSEFQRTIFNQHSLLQLAKKTAAADDMQGTKALVISIDRFNDDSFKLYERLSDLFDADIVSGGT